MERKSKVYNFVTQNESCLCSPMILKLKRPQVKQGAHVFVESEYMHSL